jgi:hypothetical protein
MNAFSFAVRLLIFSSFAACIRRSFRALLCRFLYLNFSRAHCDDTTDSLSGGSINLRVDPLPGIVGGVMRKIVFVVVWITGDQGWTKERLA